LIDMGQLIVLVIVALAIGYYVGKKHGGS